MIETRLVSVRAFRGGQRRDHGSPMTVEDEDLEAK